MHEDGRDPQSWSWAVAPLYRPGDGTAAGTKRSTEMIYRSWQPLTELVGQGTDAAARVQTAFLQEFETDILAGKRGPEAKRAAEQFCASFIELPLGEFRMGSPPEKQGMPEDLKRSWKVYLDQGGDPEQRAEQHLARWTYAPTKQGQRQRDRDKQFWTGVFRNRDVELLARCFFISDATPMEPMQKVDAFLLSRWPTINAWYRLFDPGHGQPCFYYGDQYAKISALAETPAIYASWYDAWVFCAWARWAGRSCRLPCEREWEYAAKAGTAWDWNYWWGDDFDAEKCNTDRRVGHATPPTSAHANPWGFEDILGNVWEWCDGEFRPCYDRHAPAGSPGRVMRGCSWDDNVRLARCASRLVRRPSCSVDDAGFRVARALQ
jgi:formylglycine-generating enzyme required for sulfatase activity